MARYLSVLCLAVFSAAMAAPIQAASAFGERVVLPQGAILGGGDCNDNDAAVYPGQVEIAGNFHDDDCDGLADEAPDNTPSDDNSDADGDGISITVGDCDDTDAGIRPGATEIVGNFVDDDCDALADEDASNHPSGDSADHDGDHVIIAPDRIFASGFELPA